jgi:hypothetical protein
LTASALAGAAVSAKALPHVPAANIVAINALCGVRILDVFLTILVSNRVIIEM